MRRLSPCAPPAHERVLFSIVAFDLSVRGAGWPRDIADGLLVHFVW